MPTTGTPPVQSYRITLSSADRPLRVDVWLGGQIHLCDPAKTLAFSALYPQGDVCSLGGKSHSYAMDFGSGVSVLLNSAGTAVVAYDTFSNPVEDLRFIKNVATGKTELVAGTSAGDITQIPANLSSATATRLINWREVPTLE